MAHPRMAGFHTSAAAVYLCSPAGGWVTGKVFEVDGGTVASNWPLELPSV